MTMLIVGLGCAALGFLTRCMMDEWARRREEELKAEMEHQRDRLYSYDMDAAYRRGLDSAKQTAFDAPAPWSECNPAFTPSDSLGAIRIIPDEKTGQEMLRSTGAVTAKRVGGVWSR